MDINAESTAAEVGKACVKAYHDRDVDCFEAISNAVGGGFAILIDTWKTRTVDAIALAASIEPENTDATEGQPPAISEPDPPPADPPDDPPPANPPDEPLSQPDAPDDPPPADPPAKPRPTNGRRKASKKNT